MSGSKQIGPYRILGTLGAGGNATVYRAIRDGGGAEVALKVRAGKRTAEPYRRFKQEIETLQRIGGFSGVLPVLDAQIPDSLSKDNPAWLAMPIARPIREVLTTAQLEQVVDAAASVADTLARLQEEHGLGHRDVKPPNLYELDGEWLIGDFGLVDVPEGEDLTATGKPVGSRHYTPWEMISNPASADSHPADVYALGKTLWVLATGQTYPPEGPQEAGVQGTTIDEFRPHPRALHLERLIERMTLRDPNARPSKREVAQELRTWVELPTPAAARDVSAIRAKLQTKLATEMSAVELRQRKSDAFTDAFKHFENRFDETINQMLRDVHPRPGLDDIHDKMTQNLMQTLETTKDRLKRLHRCSSIAADDPTLVYALRAGRGLEVFEDGELVIHAFVDVGYPATNGTDYSWQMDPISVDVESIEIEKAIEDAISQIAEETLAALEVFAQKLPAPR